MAETLTVALRVAEEAIEEAIAKAEEFSDSLVRLGAPRFVFAEPRASRVRRLIPLTACCPCVCLLARSQEKQNEARYLRDHKEELIEELATTIVQKVRV